jgi:MraZ protein
VDEQSQTGEVRRPRGMFSSRVDDKGRLKLPAEIQRYLTEAGATQVFITSFDGRTAQIYPIPVWEEAERLLESPGPHAKDGKKLWFRAQKYGGDAEIDTQGRLLMPATLRREMGVENQPVQMAFFRGHLEVYSIAEFEARDQASTENTDEIVETFVGLGLR